jgi:hypothetical protein
VAQHRFAAAEAIVGRLEPASSWSGAFRGLSGCRVV